MKKVLIIAPVFIVAIILLSICLSFQWNEKAHKLMLDYQNFSQFIAGFGTLSAALIAVFINQINKYFEKTDITLEGNPNDGNYDFKDHSVSYFFHLKAINKNHSTTVNNFILVLEPSKIGSVYLDIPRSFSFASNPNIFENSFKFEEYLNLCIVDLFFINYHASKMTFSIGDNRAIQIDLLNQKNITLPVTAHSSSFTKAKKYKILINLETKEIEDFIKKCKKIRDDYITENFYTNNIGQIKDEFHFEEFYRYIKVTVEKV